MGGDGRKARRESSAAVVATDGYGQEEGAGRMRRAIEGCAAQTRLVKCR